MRTLKAVIYRNWRVYIRDFPIAFFVNRVLESSYKIVSFWLMYVVFFQSTTSNEFQKYALTDDYMTYAVIGLAFHNLSIGLLMNVSRSMITEHREGTLIPLMLSPYSKVGYFIGIFIEQLGRLFLEFICILIVGHFFGAKVFNISLTYWLIGISIALLFVGSMTIILNNVMLHFRDTYISQNTLFIILFLICGVSFPIEFLPSWLSWISYCFPLTQAIAIFRKLVFNQASLIEIFPLLVSGSVCSLIYLAIGILMYKKVERKVIGYIFD